MNSTDQTIRNYRLYVLKCEQEKYYIGVTSKTPEERMNEHIRGIRPAKWTTKYKPLKLIDQEDLGMMTYSQAEKRENKIIRAYLKKVGINNARGGDLRDETEYVLRFGWIWDKSKWDYFTGVMFISLAFFIMLFAYYAK